ncbi:MAG: phosphatidylcholine/phosphatidylserine synthase [Candidatus Dadabacteria bacterium]|nr:phosphatidylcholine/phosphatidylserine synthase [Candidatus Dadabacteria bacterium]
MITSSGLMGEQQKKKSGRYRMMPILPNLLTTGSLFLGLLSIMTSIQIAALSQGQDTTSEWFYRKFWWASAFIGIAGLLDLFDGRIARILKSQSNFGLSYDSLSDLVSFGVAPGVLVYVWTLMGSGKLGLMVALFYIVCTALRLARFNVQSGNREKAAFTGLPSPVAGGLMFSPVLLYSEFKIAPDENMMWFYLILAPFVGLLMVSDVPYWKNLRLKWAKPFNVLVVAAILLAAVITNPEIMVLLLVYLYSLIGLLLYIVSQLREKPKTVEETKPEEAP